ncbi:MAG: hypothetical protein V4611_00865 [Patescibacteria group bacterium]
MSATAIISPIRPTTQDASTTMKTKELPTASTEGPPLSVGDHAITVLKTLVERDTPLRPGDRKGFQRWVVAETMNEYGSPTASELDTAAMVIGTLVTDGYIRILKCKNGPSVQVTNFGKERVAQLLKRAMEAHPASGSIKTTTKKETAA